ncbi:SPFH domain-containing protein [Streptosporangium sp. DT93]|uniref:SPFH domain-containing protein n=1 Tax=Streptosporangium sp. DT93 TaxID=3393428 RepID=UPI003CECD406
MDPLLIAGLLIVLLAVFTVIRSVRIVPQARARNVERLGRYHSTLGPGLNFVIPYIDRVYPMIDLREQVVSFQPQPVITEDNLVVEIDTVLYFQVTDPRAAAYEIANYIQAVEQLTVTTLRNVVGSLDLEMTLTSRDTINSQLRGVLDEATGKWGIRVNRVEIKAIDPPKSIKEAMEKQMRAERDKRAAILNAEGQRQSQILTAEGDKQSAILRAEGERGAAILKAEGQSQAIDEVFQAVHRNDPDPKLLAYQYLQVLPELAKGPNNTFWVIPSEVTSAIQGVSKAFTEALPQSPAARETPRVNEAAAEQRKQAEQAAADAVAEAAEADLGPRQLNAAPASPLGDGLPRAQEEHHLPQERLPREEQPVQERPVREERPPQGE